MNTVWDKPLFGQQNAKTVKGESLGVLTLILYLAPSDSAGVGNVCPNATPGCIAGCLNTAGRGVYQNVQNARIAKTRAFFQDRKRFLEKMRDEIRAGEKRAKLLGMRLAVRCNGTSDIPMFEQLLAPLFPAVMFYGYTKIPPGRDRARRALPNVHLTFSMAETFENNADAFDVLDTGGNVAVVFSTRRSGKLPKSWMGYRVIDGDTHDVRFMDPKCDFVGYVIGLRAKGRARYDSSGFVQNVGL